jgi:hypothetical protein
MVNALQASERAVPGPLSPSQATAAPVAPGALARFEDGMIVVSVPLPDWAGAQETRS